MSRIPYRVGIGTANPRTRPCRRINALNKVDVIFIPSKGAAKAELADVRKDVCQHYITKATLSVSSTTPYRCARRRTAAMSKASMTGMHRFCRPTNGWFQDHMAEGGSAAFLVWGDPSLYDSTIRIIERVRARTALRSTTASYPE